MLLDLTHKVQDLADENRVQCRRDLVQQEQFRVRGERACDGDALLLATRQAIRVLLRLVLQADAVQQLHAALVCATLLPAVHLAGGQGHVVQHRHVREQVVVLEHDADARADLIRVRAWVRDVLAGQEDLAVVDPLQQVRAAQQRRLTRARGAQEDHDLVRSDVQVQATQDDVVAEALDDADGAQDRGAVVRGGGGLVIRGDRHQTVPPICSRLRSRAVYQSDRRMKGNDKMMNSRPATT